MNRELLHKLIDLIVAEVVRRVAIAVRQAQHPEDVAVLLAAPITTAISSIPSRCADADRQKPAWEV